VTTDPDHAPRARRIAGFVLLLLIGAGAGAVGFSVQPVVSGEVGPGTVVIDPAVRRGSTVVGLPPLGQIRADTHDGPLAFDAHLDRIHLEEASVVARGEDPEAVLRAQIESGLEPLLWRLARQSVVAVVVCGVAAGLMLPRRRWSTVATVVGGAVAFAAVSGAVAFGTFDPAAFDEPRFEGELERAPDIVATVQRHVDDVTVVEGRLETLADRIEGLYRSVEGDTTTRPGSATTFLHVSDIHSNPLGIQLVEETAERFAVDAIIDTGDLTSFGADIETAVAARVAAVETPYYVIPGNHDSFEIRTALIAAGVEVLDPGVVEIGGIRVLGVGEPTFTADNRVPGALHDANTAASARRIARMVEDERPDVVAVHTRRQLSEALGTFPVGLAGHTHDPHLRYAEGTAIVEAGSAGATGIGALLSDEDLAYEMQLLHFERRRLVAIDRLAFEGTDGEFRLERVLLDWSLVDGYPDDVAELGPATRRPPR
jgi:predicted phosphodiesterase